MHRTLHFQMPGKLILGLGALAELPAAVQKLSAGRALVVTDAGLVKAGIAARAMDLLASAGIGAALYDGVTSDPHYGVAEDCLAFARRADVQVVVGLGGGSSLDIAKLSAILLVHDVPVGELPGVDRVPGPGLPKVLVPTTAGTGSEVSPIAVLSDTAAHLKKGVVSDYLYADVALIDPTLAVGLPPHVTAYTGVDTLCHAIESYTNRFSQPFVDTLELEAIRLVGTHLRRAVSCGDDLEARYGMALASLYGGLCLGSVNTTAVHALAYPLGGSYDVPHGVANSLLLPYVMAFNLISDLAKFRNIAAALGQRTGDLSLRAAAGQSVEAVRELCSDVGIVSRMRDLGIPQEAVAPMAEAALQVTRLLSNNPRPVRLEDARAIYQAAW
jgi:alcohol dehydrogenase class IV